MWPHSTEESSSRHEASSSLLLSLPAEPPTVPFTARIAMCQNTHSPNHETGTRLIPHTCTSLQVRAAGEPCPAGWTRLKA